MDFTTTTFLVAGSMPNLVKQSRLRHWVRLELTITVTPSICSAAASPIEPTLLRSPPNSMLTLFSTLSTLARASTGGPDCGVLHLALEQRLQDEGRVRRRAAAGIVRDVGQHHGLGQIMRGDARHRRLERYIGRLGGFAHGEEFPAELARQAFGF